MKELDCLKDMLCDEVKKINAQGELNPTTLQVADTVVDIIKDIMEISEKEEHMGYNDESSYRNGYTNNYNHPVPTHNYYDNNYGSYNRNRNNSYGYDNSYSRHTATDQMIGKLEMMMQDATSKDKATIQRCIDELKNQ